MSQQEKHLLRRLVYPVFEAVTLSAVSAALGDVMTAYSRGEVRIHNRLHLNVVLTIANFMLTGADHLRLHIHLPFHAAHRTHNASQLSLAAVPGTQLSDTDPGRQRSERAFCQAGTAEYLPCCQKVHPRTVHWVDGQYDALPLCLGLDQR